MFSSEEYIDFLRHLISNLDLVKLDEIVSILRKARDGKKKVFIVGNGGSASTASHVAQGLLDVGIGAESLTDNVAMLTALANDIGYENIFVGQIDKLLNSGDVLIVISGSGNSPNIVKAVKYVNNHDGISIGLLGFDGGDVKELCQHYILIETDSYHWYYGPIEDMHLVIGHIIATLLWDEDRIKKVRSKKKV